MKKLLIVAIATLGVAMAAQASSRSSYRAPRASHSSTVHVSGHVTKTGTYVAPSYRTAPNRTKIDNWSSKPNVNPYTGKSGTKDPYNPGH